MPVRSCRTSWVGEWNETKYLVMTRESTIVRIDHIGEVKEAHGDQDNLHELKNPQIIGVSQLNKHKVCLRFKACVEPSTEGFRGCSKPELGLQ